VTAAAAQFDWHHISDRTDPQATVAAGPSWRSPAGTNRLEPAQPLAARADRAVPATATSPAAPAAAPAAPAPAASPAALPATGTSVPLALAAVAAAGGLVAARIARVEAAAGSRGAADDRPSDDHAEVGR